MIHQILIHFLYYDCSFAKAYNVYSSKNSIKFSSNYFGDSFDINDSWVFLVYYTLYDNLARKFI